jgi:hypothetical protein
MYYKASGLYPDPIQSIPHVRCLFSNNNNYIRICLLVSSEQKFCMHFSFQYPSLLLIWAVMNTVMNFWVSSKARHFLDQLADWLRFEKDYVC